VVQEKAIYAIYAVKNYAVKNLLQHSCAVTATTGKAAYSIHGCTIHSLLKLPVGAKGNKDLTGQSLVRLQNALKEISYIIIDEYSMLGQKCLPGLTNDAGKLVD